MIVCVCPNPCLDVYYYTSVLKENDTNRVENPLISAGGKGVNAARIISRLGNPPHLIMPVGGCIGSCVKKLIEEEGVFSIFIDVKNETRINTILEQKGKGKHILISSRGNYLSNSEAEKLKSAIHSLQPDFLLLGGSVPPELPDTIYAEIISELKNTKVIVDADGELLKNSVKAGAFAIKPNIFELERLVGKTLFDIKDIVDASLRIIDTGVKVVITSMGKYGAICTTSKQSIRAIPPSDVNVVNTTGAGDSLVGGFLHAVEKGMKLEDALRLGVACATSTVSKEGVKLAEKEDVERLLKKITVIECL